MTTYYVFPAARAGRDILHVLLACKRRARVKFWFIKNYMSPQMKRFLPAMAARYGFEYSTVTYKWPSWLHKQARLSCCKRIFAIGPRLLCNCC